MNFCEPVRLLDMAKRLIRDMGKDVELAITGPMEKNSTNYTLAAQKIRLREQIQEYQLHGHAEV